MHRSPFFTAIGAGAGTLATLTLVTGLVSTAALAVTKRIVRHRRVRFAVLLWRWDGQDVLCL